MKVTTADRLVSQLLDLYDAAIAHRKPRAWMDTNLSPLASYQDASGVWHQQPKSFDVMSGLGYRKLYTIYVGHYLNADRWTTRTGPLGLNDWDGPFPPDIQPAPPPTESQIRNCARLAALDGRPIIFDIESVPKEDISSGSADPALGMRNWRDVMRWAAIAAPNSRRFAMGVVPASISSKVGTDPDAEAELRALVSGVTLLTYTIEYDEAAWYTELDRQLACVRRDAPEHAGNMLALVCPFWQIYGPDPGKRNDTPLPIGLWQREIDRLVAEGCDLLPWCGGMGPEPVIEHLTYARSVAA